LLLKLQQLRQDRRLDRARCEDSANFSLTAWLSGLLSELMFMDRNVLMLRMKFVGSPISFVSRNWRGRDGNDRSVDIAKDADQRF